MQALTPEQESLALQWNLTEGDFGNVGDRELSNKFVKAAKEHRCFHCAGTIIKGERHRSWTMRWVDEDGPATMRVCSDCCATYAEYRRTGDDEPLMARYGAST